MWAIDEYAIIFRSWVWLSPPHPPIAIDNKAIAISRLKFIKGEIIYIIDKGASFCHVNRMRPDDNGMPWVTSGTQK